MPRRLSQPEFIAMIAMLFATIAFSIDAMLPALPEIGQELSPGNLNRAQLILTSFVLGMGVGTFFTGPLSDAFGRKPVIMAGATLYCLSAAAAWTARSLELVLVARFLQGLGAAGPRVVAIAIVRDLYEGRQMARLMSLVMLIFTLVPALAPTLGAGIMALTGWRGIFGAFVGFSVLSAVWVGLRQSETLPREARRPLRVPVLRAAVAEVFSTPMVRLSILVQALCMGMLFAVLSSTQQVYDITFGRGESFPLWFAFTALIAASASVINATLVVRLGMRHMVTLALGGQIALSALMLLISLTGPWPDAVAFPAWFIWTTSVFFMVGLTMGNLNALAMEPMGHVAGMAASAISAAATVAGVVIAAPIGLAFDGTPQPLAAGVLVCGAIGFAVIRRMARLERAVMHPE
ncbi:multidrug effflux MFS transporter [Actibacterium sp. MT2.3-13A]|uniref:multidrug effflux MFS transporter n=1 Tax=Actibacterium sp. MT2.3-13A TaxID=2828332 RepID=UPI001BA868AD|nr:multidrug effflux MFS transporter [Actibacterium sp. MT2.3-13A]